MGLERSRWAKEPRERNSIRIGIMRCRKVRMGHSKAEVMKWENKELMENPWASKMKDMVIGTWKSKRVSKSSWECRIKKLAEDAQEGGNGTKEPTSSVMGQESPK